ncbi:MAG: hypothetical protein IPH44_11590 [Myxococcales bacterium]|nr:hypothetical protein [Myxococcales bacterium]
MQMSRFVNTAFLPPRDRHERRPRTKILAAVAWTASLAVVVGCNKTRKPKEEVPAKPTITSIVPAKPTITSVADDPWASPAGSREDTSTLAAAQPDAGPPPAAATMLAEHEPRLLVPTDLAGFKMWSATSDQACCGVSARYLGVGDVGQHLVARVYVRKMPGETLPEIDEDHRPIMVGDHDAVIYDLRDEANTTVIWFAGPWQHVVSVDHERPRDRAAARSAASRIAPAVAAQADLYLGAAPAPAAPEQQAHLATITAANEVAHRQEETDRLKNGPTEFVAKLQEAGVTGDIVTSVSRGQLDPAELVITVGSTWHASLRQERLMAAQNMWKLWASINSPTDLDASRIKLVDANGNEVGGSGFGAGSRVKVQD